MMTKVFQIVGILLFIPCFIFADGSDYYLHKVTAKKGDGVLSLLRRYQLDDHTCNKDAFFKLNNLEENDFLLAGQNYTLPVKIYKYNGISIRSTIGIDDYDKALKIAKYNLSLKENGVRRTRYMDSKILWVPFHLLDCEDDYETSNVKSNSSGEVKEAREFLILPILGKEHERVEVLDQSLKDKVYYIISGHGGPDPGASVRRSDGYLCEDEYAYDVALRLYRKLMSHGAKAYMIIQDEDDGIRSETVLHHDKNETCLGKQSIPLNQRIRLSQRTEAVNHLYKQNKKKGYTDQTMISIHVDSRSQSKRQDVYFYYYDKSKSGKQLAEKMQKTFTEKYKVNRRSGEYSGTISPRNLYVLKYTRPKAVFVELANIRNAQDQKRLLLESNRQALANWLYLGLIR